VQRRSVEEREDQCHVEWRGGLERERERERTVESAARGLLVVNSTWRRRNGAQQTLRTEAKCSYLFHCRRSSLFLFHFLSQNMAGTSLLSDVVLIRRRLALLSFHFTSGSLNVLLRSSAFFFTIASCLLCCLLLLSLELLIVLLVSGKRRRLFF
jgi:hypothetical protein